jgi:fermentation-respiration switch protein FrsA (DUF1100 family)
VVAAAIIRASLVVVILIVSLVVFVRWLEPRFAFFPSPGETTTPTALGVAFTAESIDTRDGERLHAWRLHAAAPRARIVYFHGNGGNLSIWAPILSDLARHGFAVLAVDYRGYGLSTGRPTERGLYRDADAVLERAVALLEGSGPLIYWGRSLGTPVAAYAATRRRPDGIVLEAGFPDARTLVRGSPLLALLAVFSTYRFDTAAFLDGVQAPVLVIHGDADSVIPFPLGRALFDRIRAAKTFVAIPGGDHNDARPADEGIYWNAVDAFVDGLLR